MSIRDLFGGASAATIAVGTITTGAAGSNASISNSGTSRHATFNFTIPRGNIGNTGFYFTPIVSAAGEISFTNNGGLSNPAPVNIANISRTTRIGSSLTFTGAMSIDCANLDMCPATLASGATATINQSTFSNLAIGSGIIIEVVNSGGILNFIDSESNNFNVLDMGEIGKYWLGFFRDSGGYHLIGKGRTY